MAARSWAYKSCLFRIAIGSSVIGLVFPASSSMCLLVGVDLWCSTTHLLRAHHGMLRSLVLRR
jgi:hypothetical protein